MHKSCKASHNLAKKSLRRGDNSILNSKINKHYNLYLLTLFL